jgi:hypothetical protein
VPASKRYTISIRGETHRRLRTRCGRDGVGPIVSDLVDIALDDPAIAREIVYRIRSCN